MAEVNAEGQQSTIVQVTSGVIEGVSPVEMGLREVEKEEEGPLSKRAKEEIGITSKMAAAGELSLRVKKLSDKATLPTRGSALAAGYDLYSAVETVVPARGKTIVDTNISIAIPPGTYARVAPRSGLAWKHSIATGAGVIDEDYRGEVRVILFNHGEEDFAMKPGDRIAQLILERIVTPPVLEVEELDSTERGGGGFGSTGGFSAAPIA